MEPGKELIANTNNAVSEPQKTILDYLQSEPGNDLVKYAINLWTTLQQATLTATSQQRHLEIEKQHASWKLGVIVQSSLAAIVIVSAVLLAWKGHMDATAAGFLGVALGYILGRKTA